jgi:hypothetical protein
MSEIAPLLEKLGLKNRNDIQRTAEEILRTINRKVSAGSLQKAEAARPAIALSCAFRHMGERPPLNLWKESGLKKMEAWKETLTKVENLAGLRGLSELSLSTLAIQYGGLGTRMKDAERLLETLQARGGDLSDPVFAAAAFWIASKQEMQTKEANELKESLLSEHSIEKRRFADVVARMDSQSDELVAPKRENNAAQVSCDSEARGSKRAQTTHELTSLLRAEHNLNVPRHKNKEDAHLRAALSRLDEVSRDGQIDEASSPNHQMNSSSAESGRESDGIYPNYPPYTLIPADESLLSPAYVQWKAEILALHGMKPLPLLRCPTAEDVIPARIDPSLKQPSSSSSPP